MSRCGALLPWLLIACAPDAPPKPPQVEAVFDVPREYRVLSALPCAEGAGLVYLLTSRADLYSFRPDALELKRIGHLSCPGSGGELPNSMAVDRSGTAWLNYLDGSLFRASTRDASCQATGFVSGQHGFGAFGMAFAATGPQLMAETLFVWGGLTWGGRYGGQRGSSERGGLGLAKIDRKTLALTPLGGGDARFPSERAELTGTGDGRLFGFFATLPATLARIDMTRGTTSAPQRLEGVHTGEAWAFSFWGGDFYLYWAPYGHSSHVSRLSGRDGTIEQVMSDVGIRIVGAGVSTCAPTG